MKIENVLKIVVGFLSQVADDCHYCERTSGLYKYGAMYESDIADFEMFRG